jgi:DNA-directed RNA polymerase sigma subunit (sigma70/sigma32)
MGDIEDEEDEEEEKQPQNNEAYMSQQDVADVLGRSRNRISEIEKKALEKFKYHLFRKYKKKDVL